MRLQVDQVDSLYDVTEFVMKKHFNKRVTEFLMV